MYTAFNKYKHIVLVVLVFLVFQFGFSQSETSTWKAQIAFGVNSPSQNGFVTSFESKPINFPTINLGVQYMLNPLFGAKLDYGYNRITHKSGSPYFKVNYSRINAQIVHDATPLVQFLPVGLGLIGHVGPGITFVKPLGNFTQNNVTFLNVMAGVEFHYTMSRTFSLFFDASYVYGFAKTFSTAADGFGSFNGNLFTATVGISVSLSGCYFCD